MKQILMALAAMAIAGAAFAQGKVSFGNDSSHLYVVATPLPGDSFGPIPVSPLPSGKTLVAALYGGTTAGSLAIQSSFALDAAGWLTDGRQVNKNVILTGIPGGSVAYFQIFITELGATLPSTVVGGSTYFSSHCYFGTSGLFTATPGSSITYPGLISGGPAGSTWSPGNLGVSSPIPEPSVVVLWALTAGVMLGFRRRH